MRFSETWLRDWVSPELTTQALADQITMAGLEVDAIEAVAGDFEGVVVAEVVAKEPHPSADKLNVCQVNDGGDEPLQVVCGAPNVAVGQKVPFARVNATLPGDFKIKKAKLRGVESRGMICSASELELEDGTSAGIMVLSDEAPVGASLRDWLALDDHAIEVDLTPNRGDCLSLKGLAREVGVLSRLPVTEPDANIVPALHQATFPVRVESPAKCPRYAGRIIRGVDVAATTPLWMTERLRRSGVRAIDPVVDVTNYVMLELGQPMHAFDLAQLNDAIVVREAQDGERLTLLDGQEIALHESTLVIADAKQPLAIAGVMGGESSGVNASTQDIFLESAFFSPLAVAGQARSYGLHTDASHRFERGVDPQLAQVAIERATQLLLDIVGGEPGPVTDVMSPDHLPLGHDVILRRERLDQCLALVMAGDDVVDILSRLGMHVDVIDSGWRVTIPSWRFDISLEEDLIEELARIHGYDQVPVRRPSARLKLSASNEARQPLARLRRHLVARGYQEAITYSFVAPELQETLTPGVVAPYLANPISADMSVMRASLLPGLVKALSHNLNRQQARIRLFETGLVFRGELDELEQVAMLGGIVCGPRQPEGWSSSREGVDFFDLKGDLESLMALTQQPDAWRFDAGEHPGLHPGQTARIVCNGRHVGWVGALHPGVRANLGIKTNAFVFELELDALTQGDLPAFAPLSRHPDVRRDLALVVSDDVPVMALMDVMREQAGEWLVDMRLFDVYQGEGIEKGHKSLALGLTWQHPSRTLNDDEINQLVDAIVGEAKTRFAAVLRS